MPKAVACGYSEGAGFSCSNGTLPFLSGLLRLVGDYSSTRRRRAVSPGPEGVHTRLAVSASDLRLSPVARSRCPRRGPTSKATPRRRRGGGDSSRRHRQGGVPVCLGTGLCHRSRPSAGHLQGQASALRRRRAPAEDSSRRRRRAGDGCDLWFQSPGQRQWHCWPRRDGTRTAARLRRRLLT